MRTIASLILLELLSVQAHCAGYAPVAETACSQDCNPILGSDNRVYYISEARTLIESFDDVVTTLASRIGSKLLVQEDDGIVVSSSNQLVKWKFSTQELIGLGQTDSIVVAFQRWGSGKWVAVTKKAIWLLNVESGKSSKLANVDNYDYERSELTVSPTQGRIYISTFPNGILCLSLTGQKMWSADPQRIPNGIATVIGSLHILPEGQSIAVLADGLIVKLDAKGGELWRNEIGDGKEEFAHHGVVTEKGLCVATYVPKSRLGNIICIDIDNGQIKWKSQMNHGCSYGPYFSKEKNELFVVFKDSGSEWYDMNGKSSKLLDSNRFISPPFFNPNEEPMFIRNNGTIEHK